jgi:hypothetical protein
MSKLTDLIAAINRLAAAIEATDVRPQIKSAPTVGRCLCPAPNILKSDLFGMVCVLPFGHLGAHTNGDDAHWSSASDLGPAPKGFRCAAGCGHSIAVHREAGCDMGDCDCPAPYGRLMRQPDVPDDLSTLAE